MLAKTPIVDTYLSAEALGITQAELDALKWVREELASGRIEKGDPVHVSRSVRPTHFNMDCYSCHTAVCVAGWMGVYLNTPVFEKAYAGRHVLSYLFYPLVDERFSDLTPAQAVHAIDFWATGHQSDCWALALSAA